MKLFLAIFLIMQFCDNVLSAFNFNSGQLALTAIGAGEWMRQILIPRANIFGKIVERNHYSTKYDFVIVGSGPAGCVLANRLSENPKWKVLLIEAGNVEGVFSQIPGATAFLQSTSYRWPYASEPQEYACSGMYNRSCQFPIGKALGGSSVLNYMMYSRGNRLDYDQWAANGNYGWSWDDVLPYFKKSEHSTLADLQNSPNHGRNGPANIEYIRHPTRLADVFIEAHKFLGIQPIDYNSGDQLGVSNLQTFHKNGMRYSSFRAFVEPILHRTNLDIMTQTRATKILIDPKTKTAYGIECIRNKKRFKVKAKREVILSAGAFNSPQLLMLSGIGPRAELDRIGVPVIQELPVGSKLFEHLAIIGITFHTNTTGNSPSVQSSVTIPELVKFIQGHGSLVVAGAVALSFIKTQPDGEPTLPDIELTFNPGSFHSDEGTGIRAGTKISDEIYNRVYKPLESSKTDTFTIIPVLLHPKSVGYIQLKDNNPLHHPKFYPNFLQHPDDVETLLAGIKFILKLVKTPPFQEIGARLHDIPLPGCSHIHFASDNYWRCFIRTICLTFNHQTGTARMGPEWDPTAVVSPELKVHGINRLRVADISIIPGTVSSHTQAVSMMIGEKTADMINHANTLL